MYSLFIQEFRRFRLVSSITALLLSAIMVTLSAIEPIMKNGLEVLVYQGSAIVLAFALGCTQILLHKRKGNWAYLIHRPIPPKNIFFSLVCAGIFNLVIALALPLLLVFLGLDLLGVDVVELRHYLFTLHVLLAAVFVYLVGVYIVLSPNKASFLCIALLYFVWSSDPNSAIFTLTVDLIAVLIMFLLGKNAFKVNLSEHHQSMTSRLVAITALHMGLMAVLMLGQMIFYHLPMSMLDKHPDNYSKQQLQDSFALLWQLTPEELIDFAVDEATYPQKSTLQQQIKHADSIRLRLDFRAQKHLGQIFHQDGFDYALVDTKNKQQWIFSHQQQIFIGKSHRNNELVGYLTRTGFLPASTNIDTITEKEKFFTVPRIIENQFIQESDRIYQVDFVGRYIDVKHQLPEGEYYVNALQLPQGANSAVLVSNKAIYAFDFKKFSQQSEAVLPKIVIELVKPNQSMKYVEVFNLIDGYLLKFADRHYFGFDQPGVGLLYAKLDGERILVAEKAFEQYRPLPRWVGYQAYWMSPLVYSVLFEVTEDVFKHQDDPSKQTFESVWDKQYPSSVYWLVALNLLITSLLTLALGIAFKKKKLDIAFWLFVVLLFGLPGFLSFLLMNHWREFWKIKRQKERTTGSVPHELVKA